MKQCPLNKCTTNCTEHCKECAKDLYRELKSKAGKAEFVTETAIKNDLGNEAFELLKEYGYIECCGTLSGRKVYAI